MPSFDIVSRLEMHELDNAVNNALKQIGQRYDFRGSPVEIKVDAKAKNIHLVAADKMKIEAVGEILRTCAAKRGVDLKALDFGEAEPGAGASYKQDVKIREGLEQPLAKDIVKRIKQTKLKVQASIQGDEVRVSGKKIDDLQSVIQLLKGAELDAPLQYVNMKS